VHEGLNRAALALAELHVDMEHHNSRMSWRVGALREQLDRVTARQILIAGWLWFLVYAYPGHMSYDSIWQLTQVRNIAPMNEWHPPLMAFVWSITDTFLAGPFPMLVIQSVAFLLGLAILLRQVFSPRAAALLAVIMLLLPQNIIVMAVIWKDSQMAGFLLASIAALLSKRRGWRIAGFGFVFLATAFRYNAAAATLPIVLMLWAHHRQMPWWRRYAIGTGIWIGITLAAVVVSAQFVEERQYPWHVGSAPVDIVGTIRFSPKMTDEQVLELTEGVPWLYKDKLSRRTRSTYNPMNTFLEVTQGSHPLIDYIGKPEYRAGIARAWRRVVLARPLAFLRHRIAVFDAQLGSRAMIWAGAADSARSVPIVKHDAAHAKIQHVWVRTMEIVGWTELFRVRIYFLLLLLLLPFTRRAPLARMLAISGILHELGLFAVAPAIDYRYSQWMVLCTIVTLVLVITDRIRLSGTQ
jgi:hypothetical protein